MSYVSPSIQAQFDSMPEDLQEAILAKDVRLENLGQLMAILEQIIQEGE